MDKIFCFFILLNFLQSSVNSLKCYSGQVIIGHPDASQLPVQKKECEDLTDMCITINYNMSFPVDNESPFLVNVSSVQGACGFSHLGCDYVCRKLKESLRTVTGCKSSCCYSDFCNVDVGSDHSTDTNTDIIDNKTDDDNNAKNEIPINNRNNNTVNTCSNCSISTSSKCKANSLLLIFMFLMLVKALIT